MSTKKGWRIYNVVGCVKDFLSTPHPRRAERLEGVRAHALWQRRARGAFS